MNRVALAVRDPARSLALYRDNIGIEGAVREEHYGFVITAPAGLSFTLVRGEQPADGVGETHIGVSLAGAGEVRAERLRLTELGIAELEWWDEPGYVSTKVNDPDGYPLEVAWDEHP